MYTSNQNNISIIWNKVTQFSIVKYNILPYYIAQSVYIIVNGCLMTQKAGNKILNTE